MTFNIFVVILCAAIVLMISPVFFKPRDKEKYVSRFSPKGIVLVYFLWGLAFTSIAIAGYFLDTNTIPDMMAPFIRIIKIFAFMGMPIAILGIMPKLQEASWYDSIFMTTREFNILSGSSAERPSDEDENE